MNMSHATYPSPIAHILNQFWFDETTFVFLFFGKGFVWLRPQDKSVKYIHKCITPVKNIDGVACQPFT